MGEREVLEQAAALAEGLIGALEAEYRALSQGDIPALQRALEDKQRLAGELERLGQTLAPPRDQALVPLWEALNQRLKEGQALNQRNGTVIFLTQRHLHGVLALLRGEGLYGPGASPLSSPPSRSIAKV